MRVISGIAKNRRLKFPRGPNIRPTLDNVKEALFSILGEYTAGKETLDLFTGSGALGIEALSRGAKKVTFIDNDPRCTCIVKENLESLNFTNKAIVLTLDAREAIKYLESKNKKFDLVLADPPYSTANIFLKILAESDILKNCFVAVIEHHKKDILAGEYAGLIRSKLARYGDTMLSFYKRR